MDYNEVIKILKQGIGVKPMSFIILIMSTIAGFLLLFNVQHNYIWGIVLIVGSLAGWVFIIYDIKKIPPNLKEFRKILEGFGRIINDSYSDSIRSVMLKLNNAYNPHELLGVITNSYYNIRKPFENDQITSAGLDNAIDSFNSLLSDFQQKIIKDFIDNHLPLNANPSPEFKGNYTALKVRHNDYFISWEKFIKSIGKNLYSGIIFLPD